MCPSPFKELDMNKTIIVIALLCVCAIVYGATGRSFEDGNYYKTTVYTTTYSGPQTQTTGVAYSTGLSIVIDKIIWSAATAAWMYISDVVSDSTPDYGYVYSGTSSSFLDNDVLMKLTASQGLYVTTSGAGYLHLEYHYEGN